MLTKSELDKGAELLNCEYDSDSKTVFFKDLQPH